MSVKSFLSLAALALAFAGCSSSSAPPEAQKPPRKDTVFDPLTSTIDRAKGVQQTVDDQAAEQRKKIEAAEK